MLCTIVDPRREYDMSIDANKEIARRFAEEIWGDGDVELANELISPDCIDHNPGPGLTADRAGHNQLLMQVHTGLCKANATSERRTRRSLLAAGAESAMLSTNGYMFPTM